MRRVVYVLSIAMLVSFPGVGRAQVADDEPSSVAPPWLAGCWEMRAGELVIEEHWMSVRGGTMLGMNRAVRGGELAGYELLILRDEGSSWVYEAHPSGQSPASFRSAAITDTSIAFSNPDHDFPQTITYSRISADSLVARTAGESGGKVREMQFRYRRVPCPGSDQATSR
jgi:hypothetical protein